MSINNVNPMHFQNFHIALLKYYYFSDNLIYFTPKIDGVHSFINCNNFCFEAEKINSNFYVYPTLQKENNQSFLIKLKTIEKIFNKKYMFYISSVNNILDILKNFNNNTKYNNILLKPIFVIDQKLFPSQNWIELLHFIQNEYVTIYPNDGWICYLDKYKYPLKIKPLKHLTIDLMFDPVTNKYLSFEQSTINVTNVISNTKCIVRCYYENNQWVAKDLRIDKKIANKNTIIKSLDFIHKNNINYVNLWNSDLITSPYHSGLLKMSTNCKKFLHDIRFTTLEYIKNELLHNNNECKSLLDMGCGNGNLGKYLHRNKINISYTGIEIDPIDLCYAYYNGLYYWADLNCFSSDQYFTHTTFINSLHYVTNKYDLFKKLYDITDCIIVIGIFENNYKNDIDDRFVRVKKHNNKFEFNYGWKKNTIIEKILNKNNLLKISKKTKWKLKYNKLFPDINNFYNLHEMLVFEK